MSEISCNTIKDILPLYVDEVVSDDTRNIVSKHLEYCENCRKKYESMKSEVSIPIENNAKPLKQFKNAWKRKKIVLICSTVIITVAIVCCAIFAFNHFAYKDEIAVNGAVYTQSGKNITTLPVGSTELGMLNSITHRTTSNPTEDFTATNLDEKYAGCIIYQSGDSNSIIYLEDYSGFYIPFELTEYITQPERD